MIGTGETSPINRPTSGVSATTEALTKPVTPTKVVELTYAQKLHQRQTLAGTTSIIDGKKVFNPLLRAEETELLLNEELAREKKEHDDRDRGRRLSSQLSKVEVSPTGRPSS